METKVNVLSDCEKSFEFKLSYEEIKQDLEKAILREAKKVQIDGFRKGKAPLTLIKKRYGAAIEYDECEKLANKYYQQYVKENEVKGLSTPALMTLNYDPEKELTFTINLEVMPELSEINYKGLQVTKVIMPVTDKMVDDEIELIVKRNATLEDAEVIENTDYYVSYELVRKGDEAAQPVKLPAVLSDLPDDNELKTKSIGKKTNDSFEFTFVDKHDHTHEDGKVEEHAETFEYTATVKEIKKIVKPELNEEFIKQVTKDRFTNLEELKADVKKQFEEIYTDQAEKRTEDNLIRAIIEKNPFKHPERYASEMLEMLVKDDAENAKKYKQYFNEEDSKKRNVANAETYVRWFILRDLIVKAEGIKVEDADIENSAKEYSDKYGVALDKAKEIFSNPQRAESMLYDKMFKMLEESNNFVEEVVEAK